MYGGRGSSGTVFSLRLMPARSRASRAFLPDRSGSKRAEVDEHQVVVGAARHQPQAVAGQRLGQRRRVAHDLGGVVLELRRGRLGEGDRLGRDDVVERPALQAGEHRLVDDLGQLARCTGSRRPAGPRRVLWVVKVMMSAPCVHRVRVLPAGDEAGDVGGVEHEQRADLVGDGAERLGVDDARVGGGAGDDDLRPVLEGDVAHLVEVDALVARRDAVGHEAVELAAGVHRRAVGEVAALVEAQAEHGVARLQQRQVHGHVGVGAGVGLHVGVRRAEQRLGPLAGDVLDLVDDLVAAVVALARVALAVLVGEHRARGAQHRRRGEVLAGDQLEGGVLALDLAVDEREDLVVGVAGPASWRWPPRLRCRRSGRRGARGGRPRRGWRATARGSRWRGRRRRCGRPWTARWRRCARGSGGPCRGRCTARPARRGPCWRRSARPGRSRRARSRGRPRRRRPPGRRPRRSAGSRPTRCCGCRGRAPRGRGARAPHEVRLQVEAGVVGPDGDPHACCPSARVRAGKARATTSPSRSSSRSAVTS